MVLTQNYLNCLQATRGFMSMSTTKYIVKVCTVRNASDYFYVTPAYARECCTDALLSIGTGTPISSLSHLRSYVNGTIGSPGICIGTGSTPATKDDIGLEAPITFSLESNTTCSLDKKFQVADGVFIADYKYTIVNNMTSDIVFREIGFFRDLRYNGTSTYNGSTTTTSQYAVMFWRHVFDEDITIPSGESVTINFRIRIPNDPLLYPDVAQSTGV